MQPVHIQQSLFDQTAEKPAAYRRTYAYRVSMVREKRIRFDGGSISTQYKAAQVIRNTIQQLGQIDREHFVVMLLNTRHHIIGTNIATVGTLNSTQIAPRETFKPAIILSAASIIIGHNHPSGDVEPSREDKRITQRFIAAAELLGIPVLDHVIVSAETDAHYSFNETGELKRMQEHVARGMRQIHALDDLE